MLWQQWPVPVDKVGSTKVTAVRGKGVQTSTGWGCQSTRIVWERKHTVQLSPVSVHPGAIFDVHHISGVDWEVS